MVNGGCHYYYLPENFVQRNGYRNFMIIMFIMSWKAIKSSGIFFASNCPFGAANSDVSNMDVK
jgi:hypothetical protein